MLKIGILKRCVIFIRTWIKLILLLLISVAIIGIIVFSVYNPMYSVTLDGEFIGYTEDKRELQSLINEYRKSGDGDTIAFVEIETLPEYTLCLLKKGQEANDDEIFDTVIDTGTPYYKYYAILEDNEEKYYVKTYEEAEAIITSLTEQNSKNKDSVSYLLKYETELKDFTDTETAVAALYVETPAITTVATTVVTTKTVDYTATDLGIALIEPVSGTISSRFGSRSRGLHTGLDIATTKGTPIKAAADGIVIYSGYKGSYGNMVVIQHTDTVETYYCHCNALYVSVGDTVSQGDVIAAVGSTGNSTGPHLHLEIRVNRCCKKPTELLI